MSESWKQWQGRTVDAKFPLQSYLGGSDHSAVFLTAVQGRDGNAAAGDSTQAAIKLIESIADASIADAAGGETQIARWQGIRELKHPSLIRILDSGRCELDGVRLVYVVMEYAEENLSQILPVRALTAEETLGTLPPVLEALQFVHDKGYVHGHIKPTNILAIGNEVKLSSDTLSRTGELIGQTSRVNGAGAYDPPEAPTATPSTAGDVWQLGMTLTEVLTQRLPVWDRGGRSAPVISDSVPQPFRDIARHCLQVDAGKRWTISEISERLKAERTGTARQTADQFSGQNISAAAVAGQQSSARNLDRAGIGLQTVGLQKETAKWPIWVAIAAVVVIAFVLIARPKRSSTRSAQPATETQQGAESQNSQPPARVGSAGGRASGNADAPNSNLANSEAADDAQSGIVQRVMPQVSPSARRTIQGKIKVRVRVGVDAAGNVSSATLESAGPSKYFSRISIEAARAWKFVPADAAEQSGRREWKIQFAFTRARTEASAMRVKR
jgi:TonB family protein